MIDSITMIYNIYQVKNESDIKNILNTNSEKLVTLIFSASNSNILPKNIDIDMKKKIKRIISKKYVNVLFIYVDLNDYRYNDGIYTENINRTNTPYVSYHWRNKELGKITKATPGAIDEVTSQILNEVKKYLDQKIINDKDSNSDNNTNSKIASVQYTQQLNKNENYVQQPVNQSNCQQPVNQSNCQQSVNQSNCQQPVNQPNCQQPVNQSNCQQPVNQPNCQQPVNQPNYQQENKIINQSFNQNDVQQQAVIQPNRQQINDQQLNQMTNHPSFNQNNVQQVNQITNHCEEQTICGQFGNQISTPQVNHLNDQYGQQLVNSQINVQENQISQDALIEMQKIQENINFQEKMKKIEELRKEYAIKEIDKFIKMKEKKENNQKK